MTDDILHSQDPAASDDAAPKDAASSGVNDDAVLHAPDLQRAAARALVAVPKDEDDYSARVRAKTLSEALGRAIALAKREAPDGTAAPEERDAAERATADAIGATLTGKHDYDGAMWNRQRPFASGAAYAAHMRDLVLNSPDAGLTEEAKAFYAADYDTQVRLALEHEGTLDAVKRVAADALDALRPVSRPLSRLEESEADDETRGASATVFVANMGGTDIDEKTLDAAKAKVAAFRERRRREEIRRKYEAKLNADNAWNALTSILPTLSEDAQTCAKAILDSPENKLPYEHYAKFNALPRRERELVVQTRQLAKDRVDSGVWNTLQDAGIGAFNVASAVVAAPFRQGAKLGRGIYDAVAGLNAPETDPSDVRDAITSADEAGLDVNELAVRRQLLWQATGDFLAGGDLESAALPQLQFEQVCEDHGVVGEAVIGAVSTLPYMAAAAIPRVGLGLVALEAMQEFDDHVALNGGDITDRRYLMSSFVMGGLYAYVERLQVERLIGGVSEQRVREGLLKGFWSGIKNGTVPRVLTVETLSESIQEGLQNGVMAVNNAYALDEDAVRGFGEAFVDDFVGSLGTMAIVGAGGLVVGHARRSGLHVRGRDGLSAADMRRLERSADLTNLYRTMFAHDNMVEAAARSSNYRRRAMGEELQALRGRWLEGGKAALVAQGGVSEQAAESLDGFFAALRAAEGSEAVSAASSALGEWNAARGLEASPKAGERGDIGQQYLENLIRAFTDGGMSRDDFTGRLVSMGFSEKGAGDYAAWAALERAVRERAAQVGAFVEGRYERKYGSNAAESADVSRVRKSFQNLDRARSVWAQGLGVYSRNADGSVQDPGAKALEAFGFAKEDAESLSRLFHYERAAACSRVALDGVRALYEKATKGRVGGREALAREFKGRVVRLPAGTDAKGRETFGDFIRFEMPGGRGEAFVRIVETRAVEPDFSKANPFVAESVAETAKGWAKPVTADDWMRATPDERRRIWREHGLHDEGLFVADPTVSLVLDGDPSARVDSDGAKRLVFGTIALADESGVKTLDDLSPVKIVDSSAGFHEVYHAWEHFMRATGQWTEKEEAALAAKYGKALGGRHDEEAAANAMRSYMNRRIEGRMSAEDETSPFGKIYALARRLVRRGEEMKAKERIASTAEEAFFDQIVADRYSGVGELGKPEKKEEKGGEKGKSEASAAPQMPGRKETSVAAPAPAASSTEAGSSASKPGASPLPAAQRGWTAYTPTGNVKVGGHYAVVDLSEIVHSNNPAYALYMRAQLRNRKDNKAEEDTRKDIVNNFQAERLLEAPDTANGAPIVFAAPDEKGVSRLFVLSGNGRVLVLNELAERHLYDRYRNVMKAWAAENGLAVPEGETPVLVRVVTDFGGATREQVADLSNTNSIQQYTEEEQARADAEVVKALGIAGLYHANANGTADMTPGVNDEFFAAFIRGVGDTSLYNSDRSLTETARVRAVRALLAIAVGQGPRGRDVVRKLVEQTDTLNIARQKNAAAIMAAAVASLEEKDAYAIGPDLSRAMADFVDFAERRKAGKVATFDDYYNQMDLLDAPSEISREILRLFGSKQPAADIAEYVTVYCNAAAQEDPTGGLFGKDAARSRLDVWNDAKRLVDSRRVADGGAARHSFKAETRTLYHGSAADWIRPDLRHVGEGQGGDYQGYGLNMTTSRSGAELWASVAKTQRALRAKGPIEGVKAFFAPKFVYSAEMDKSAHVVGYFDPVSPDVAEAVRAALDAEAIPLSEEDEEAFAKLAGRPFERLAKFVASRERFGVRISPKTAADVLVRAGIDASWTPSVSGDAATDRDYTVYNVARLTNYHQWANGVQRHSFKAAAPEVTASDFDAAIEKYGEAEDVSQAVYALPDGRLLRGKGVEITRGGRTFTSFGHDGLAEDVMKKVAAKASDGKSPAASLDERMGAARRAIARAGAIRLGWDGSLLETFKEPTPAQCDRLYDVVYEAYDLAERQGDVRGVTVDVSDADGVVAFAVAYRAGTSPRRIVEDLRGWYREGVLPLGAKGPAADLAQVEASPRHSIAGVDFSAMAKYYQGDVREIARELKRSNPYALKLAAEAMARAVPDGAVLVPVPGHDGRAGDTFALANEIAAITGSPVVEALRGTPRRAVYEQKREGVLPSASALGFRRFAALPPGREVVFVDNVVGTGTTAVAAREALGTGRVLAFAWDHTAPRPVGVVGGLDGAARHSFAGLRGQGAAGVRAVGDAEALESRGVGREAVFRLTGWYRGADGRWRVELPFHGAFVFEGDFDDGLVKGYRTVGDYFDWPELFQAYPELKDVEVRFDDLPDDVRGDFDPKTKTIRIANAVRRGGSGALARRRVAPVMVHEIQHAIQSIENHARGGDPDDLLALDRKKALDEVFRLSLARALAKTKAEKAEISEKIEELERSLAADAEAAFERYYRLAGEVEARNAALRFSKSPSWRLSHPPWETEEVGRDRQLVDFKEEDGVHWDDAAPDARRSVTSAWGEGFPDVAYMTTRKFVLANPELDRLHREAKAGSLAAALAFVDRLLPDAPTSESEKVRVRKIKDLAADHPTAVLVPVVAMERTGHNMLPFAYAQRIGEITGLKLARGVKQSVKANHTGASGLERLVRRAEFVGDVTPGREYVMVDDHVTQGGTLAALRRHVADRGGKVVAATTLTTSRGSSILSPRDSTLEKLAAKFASVLAELKEAGAEDAIADLTESQARQLLKYSVDSFGDLAARALVRRRGEGAHQDGPGDAGLVRAALRPGGSDQAGARPGMAGGMGDPAGRGAQIPLRDVRWSFAGRSKALDVGDVLPGLRPLYDHDAKRLGETFFARSPLIRGPVSKDLHDAIDEAGRAGEMPDGEKRGLLERLVGEIKASKEGKVLFGRYRTGDSWDGTEDDWLRPERVRLRERIFRDLVLAPVTSANSEALEPNRLTGKAKGAEAIARSNAANPDLPKISLGADARYAPSRERRLDIVMGPSAAGKSSVFVDLLSVCHRARVFDSDAVKKRLPGFDGGNGASFVHEESSRINKEMIRRFLDMNTGENVVLPIVGATEKGVRRYVELFRDAGYAIYLHNDRVPILHAFHRAWLRTLATGRLIAPEVFLGCMDNPSVVFERLRREVDFWDEFDNDDVTVGAAPRYVRGNYSEPAYGTASEAASAKEPGLESLEDWKKRLATPQAIADMAAAMDMEERGDKAAAPVLRQGEFDFGPDAEASSRHAIRADLGERREKAAAEALTNWITYFRLSRGSVPMAKTIARMGLAMGMGVVDTKRILQSSESRAEQMRGSLIEKAAQNGDVATTLALLKREDGIDESIDGLLAGSVAQGGELTRAGSGRINTIIGKRVEQMMRDFSAASLADMEGETGLDLAAEILEQNPDAFAGEVKSARGADAADDAGKDAASDADKEEGGGAADESRLSDLERHVRERARQDALKKVESFIARAKARAEENRARAEERRRRGEADGGRDGAGVGDGADGRPAAVDMDQAVSDAMGGTNPKNVKADFRSKEEFAAFLRVWAEHKFDKTHGLSSLGKTERGRLFAEFYRITVRKELQDLADKLLAPKDESGFTVYRLARLGNGARNVVSRRLARMEKGIRPDAIERMSADVFAFINAAAIRVSRTDLVNEFKKEIKSRYVKGERYEDLKLDADRRVTGWVEEAARYICRVCDLSKRGANGDMSQLERERKALLDVIDRRADVYDESGKDAVRAPVEDMETKKAMWKLALLDKYGAMASLMPGEILDLRQAAIEHLERQAGELERLWQDARAYEEGIRSDLAGAIAAPNGQRYQERGWLGGRLFDALNGLLRLRLEHLTRFADEAAQKRAKEAINKVIVLLGDGETAYARMLQDDRRALFEGLAHIFGRNGRADNAAIKRYLNRMTEPIPVELARRISSQGFVGTMTYGQMLQLLVSLEQRSFKDAVEHNGRQGQAELIRTFETTDADGRRVRVFTEEDGLFVDWLRAFYAAKRDVISPVTLRMVGQAVDSPDPLYCPVRRSMDDRTMALAEAGSTWDPVAAVFSRRVKNDRDFDEQASVLGMFFDRSRETAKLVAWAERGTIVRGVFTSVSVQSAIRRAFGSGELRKIMKQLVATFNGGEAKSKTSGELAAVDKALNFTTYAYLGFNPLSAAKQTTSFTVWANALPGGFKDLWKYMTHFDAKALRHLMESEEYKLRYGDEVGSGQDLATKGLNMNPSMNPVVRMISGAGMWMLKKGDFAPGGWIAQGLYKDLLDRHMQEGMAFDAADRLAITETFNMLEETQQSGRTYNTNMLTIEHGRIGRLLTQFATSPLQQLQYETQAWREWRDMVRYGQGKRKIAAARQKLVRAAVINHLLLPAALNFVTAVYKKLMGDEPPWEQDGYHWTLLTEVLLGQFERVFFVGAFAQTSLKALFAREYPRGSKILPVEGALGMAASLCFTAHDVAALDAEKVRKDLERLLKSTAPTRIPFNLYRRIVGDSDVDRKAAKEKAKKRQ